MFKFLLLPKYRSKYIFFESEDHIFPMNNSILFSLSTQRCRRVQFVYILVYTKMSERIRPYPCLHKDVWENSSTSLSTQRCLREFVHILVCTKMSERILPHPCLHKDVEENSYTSLSAQRCLREFVHILVCTKMSERILPHPCLHKDV